MGPRRYWTCALLLAVTLAGAAALASFQLGERLPGCGPRSACHDLAATAWGRLPGTTWPVSFVGCAWFAALLTWWIVAGPRDAACARWLVRAGAGVSIVYLAAMAAMRKACPYCAVVHAANLACIAVLELNLRRARARAATGRRSMGRRGFMPRAATAAAAVFGAVSLALGAANARQEESARAKAESERRDSTERIVSQGSAAATRTPADPWAGGFTGRYRLGPETSPLRIVVLTDYQCRDCRRIEGEIEAVMASRPEVSLSIKHFPMCAEAAPGVPCNRAAMKTLHPNACWAARAAEAAGILEGEEGFWQMHRWLFRRGGGFTDAELAEGLRELGFDPPVFTAVMSGDETLRRVRADVEDGIALGVHYTPMIFVNGVEFRGWQTPGALERTIAEVAASGPPAATAAVDRPSLAREKYLGDWREQPARDMPADARAWSTGTPGKAEVVLFGDLQEPNTAAMDRALRAFTKETPGVRYTFRHYPLDPSCNPALPAGVRSEAVQPKACRAARAAEAAGSLAGATGYWAMQDWLTANRAAFDETTLKAAAVAQRLEPAEFLREMDSPAVTEAIAEDARAARQLGLAAVPMVFADRKWVPRTMRGEENVVIEILKELARR